MNRKPRLASTAVSSPEELSLSPSPATATASTSKKARQTTKVKGSARKVSSLNEDQLERKRANDREAQRNIRQRNKDHIKQLEAQLEEEKAKVEERDAAIRHLEQENAHLRGELQSRLAHDTESRGVSHDHPRPSTISETGSWQQPQHMSRRPSHAEAMEMRTPSITSPGSEMTHARSQTFPAPPPTYLNRNPTAFAHNHLLGQQTGSATASPTSYGPTHPIKVEDVGPYPPRMATQQDPLRIPTRSTELVQQGLVEGPPSQRCERRDVAEAQGPPGAQYHYTQILQSSSHDQHFQTPVHSSGHYVPYPAHGAYALPPPPGSGPQYAPPTPQYGPLEPYPHAMSTSTAQQPVFTPTQVTPRPPYGYYQSGYPQAHP